MVKSDEISSMLENGVNTFDTPITYRKVFTDPWHDPDIIGRDEEIAIIVNYIVKIMHHHKSYLIVEGKSGSGKSFLIRSVIKSIKNRIDPHENLDDIPKFFYVDAMEMTPSKFKNGIFSELRMNKNSTYEQIESKGVMLVVIIDRFDLHPRPDLYFKNVILPISSIDNIGLIFITGNGNKVVKFITRHAPSIDIDTLKLSGYNEMQITEILRHRLINGTSENYYTSFSSILLNYIAREVSENYDCNIRLAINILYNLIISSSDASPNVQMIDSIISKLTGGKLNILYKFNWLDDHVGFFFASISSAEELIEQQQLYSMYCKFCADHLCKPRTYVWYNNWIHKAQHMKIIRVDSGGKGTKKRNSILLITDADELRSFINTTCGKIII